MPLVICLSPCGVMSKIKPLPVGTDLELLVVLLAEAIRLEKDLRHVAVPKFVSAAIRFGIRKDVDRAIAATKAKVQLLRRPQQSNFGASLRIVVVALPVVAEAHRLASAASHLQQESR